MKAFLTLTVLILTIACADRTADPYTDFDNSNTEVAVGDSFQINLTNWYSGTVPSYTMKKNNESKLDITDSSFVLRPEVGYSGPQDLNFERVTIGLEFNTSDYSSGDVLIITSINGSIELSKIFEVL